MAEVPDTVDDAIAELSDTPTTDEVFFKTLPFQGREIASAAVSMAAAGGGGGGSSVVGCVLARDADFDIRVDSADTFVLWDALYDNFWDLNPLAAIPDGLGLDFAFDGSSSLIVPAESGVWTFSYFATRDGDANWQGSLRIGGIGLDCPWVQPRIGTGGATVASGISYLATTLATPLPAGTQLTHNVLAANEAATDPFVCRQVYLSIVRHA